MFLDGFIFNHSGRELADRRVPIGEGIKARQSPLPIHFNLVMESLSYNFKLAEAKKEVEQFIMGGAPLESHLLFANDILIFTRATP